MKKILFSSMVVFISASMAIGQEVSTAGMSADFKQFATYNTNNKNSGFEGLQTYSSSTGFKGSQFFSSNWSSGSVVTGNSVVISDRYQFVFDKVRQELFIRVKDSNVILTGDKAQIKSFTLNTDRPHTFVSSSQYDKNTKDIKFYEVLEDSKSGYVFLKFVDTKYVKANPNDIEKIRNGDNLDEFVDKASYYIYNPTTGLNKISFSNKSLLKTVAPAQLAIANKYLSDHNSDNTDEIFVRMFIENLNSNM